MGTPSASGLTRAAGAGHGEAGDAPRQGPAHEPIEALAAQPKPANEPANSDSEFAITGDEPSSVIALAERTAKPETAETAAATRKADGLVTVRPKPEKRKNAKERAKEKYAKKETEDGTTPDTTAKAKSKVDKKAAAKAKKSKSAARKAA